MEGSVTFYWENVHYFVETYATDEKTAKVDADMMRFNQSFNETTMLHSEALWNKVVEVDKVHDEYVLYGIFIEGLLESICHSLHPNFGLGKSPQYMIWQKNFPSN